MKNFSNIKIIIYTILSFSVLAIAYILFTPKIYSSKSHVALFRIKVENPDSGFDESKNRWIWIRDGLNIKSALINDEIIQNFIQNDPTARETGHNFKNTEEFKEYIKNLINIQFTGADENNYLIEVKAPSASLARSLNSVVFNRIRYLAVDHDQENFNEIIAELKTIQIQSKPNSETYIFYEDKIRKLNFNQAIEKVQRKNAFKIVSPPSLNRITVWPKKKLIIIIFVLTGLVFGIVINFLLKNGFGKK